MSRTFLESSNLKHSVMFLKHVFKHAPHDASTFGSQKLWHSSHKIIHLLQFYFQQVTSKLVILSPINLDARNGYPDNGLQIPDIGKISSVLGSYIM